MPEHATAFFSVGQWYEDFRPTSDEEVKRLLGMAMRARPPGKGERASSSSPNTV